MSPKIHAEFWTDPDLEDTAAEVKLTLLWMMTNPQIHFAGVFQVSPKRFKFETGLEETWLEETLRVMAKMFFRSGDRVLIRSFIRHQYCPDENWEKLALNNMGKGLVKDIPKLPREIRDEIYQLYPVLRPQGLGSPCQALRSPSLFNGMDKGLPSPSKPLPSPSQTNGSAASGGVSTLDVVESSSDFQKPLPSPSKDIGIGNRNKEYSEGESEGGTVKLRYDLAQQCIAYLNKKTGAAFPESHASLMEAALRLHEVGNDLDGIQVMIDRQAALWGNDARMKNFLRPTTLFESVKFHEYFAQRNLQATPAGGEDQRRELQQRIDTSPANRESVYHSAAATQDEKALLKKWRADLAELNKKTPAK